MKKLVRVGSREGETVLDPFMGSGTTAVACQQLGRRFVGIEIEQKYLDITIDRLRQHVIPFAPTPPSPPAIQAGLFEEVP